LREIDEIDAALHRLGRMLFDRDGGFADQFAEDALLVGSEPGEIAHGREAIRALVGQFAKLPARYIWDWTLVDIRVDGDMGWLFAEGEVVSSDSAGRVARPYRLSAVLSWDGSRWMWRLFHGSEPKV
jgi:ketosteroid isomerase-like protein